MTYHAVVFDLDGTLLDSEAINQEAGRIAFAEHGLVLDRKLFHKLIGKDVNSASSIIRDQFGSIDVVSIDERWTSAARQLSRYGIPLKAGANELLRMKKN